MMGLRGSLILHRGARLQEDGKPSISRGQFDSSTEISSLIFRGFVANMQESTILLNDILTECYI